MIRSIGLYVVLVESGEKEWSNAFLYIAVYLKLIDQ